MRYMPIEQLEVGMSLGKNIYNDTGQLILSKDKIFTDTIIALFKKQGYQGVYIEDKLSNDIVIEEIVSMEIRNKAKLSIKHLFVSDDADAAAMQGEINNSINDIMHSILENKDVIINMVDLKTYDDYTYSHSVNVGILSGVIGVALDFKESFLKHLITAAMLHDIGKKFLSIDLLNKTEEITQEEYEILKTHSDLGYNFVKDAMNFSSHVKTGILQHHERFDGSGYPLGKKGKEIPLISRIIGVADAYDAITSSRPYHKAFPPGEGMEYIMGNSGIGFDPKVVKIFSQKVAIHPAGTEVTLSNGERALVVKNFECFSSRPLVKLLSTGEELDLKDDMKNMNITIIK